MDWKFITDTFILSFILFLFGWTSSTADDMVEEIDVTLGMVDVVG